MNDWLICRTGRPLTPNSAYLALASVPEALDASANAVLTMAEQKELEKLRAQDQREIKALKKELQRKEKALAEMAALMKQQKKWEAYCSEVAES